MEHTKTIEELIFEQLEKFDKSDKMEVVEHIRTCKVCNQNKKRIYNGKFNFKDKRWVDENGKQWMGRTCPDCNVTRSKATMKGYRDKNKKSIS